MPTEANAINSSATGIVGNTGTAFVSTAVTQFDVIVGGSTSSTLSNVAPSATSGVPLISQGAASQPVFGTAVVAGGGTGNTTFTAYAVITAGTTATGTFQNVSGVGTSGQLLVSAGASALPAWGSFQVVKQVFTATGANTYTPTAGMQYCIVEVQGGGGGGGRAKTSNIANCSVGGGGGGGGYSRKIVSAATVGASQTATVGGGGAGGAAAGGPNNGVTGTTSSFGVIVTAAGGVGGTGSGEAATNATAGGGGGTGASGDFNLSGGAGGYGYGITGTFVIAGSGGSSFFAPTTNQNQSPGFSTGTTGTAGDAYGAGGGGGLCFANAASTAAGGAGAAGIIVITEFVIT